MTLFVRLPPSWKDQLQVTGSICQNEGKEGRGVNDSVHIIEKKSKQEGHKEN